MDIYTILSSKLHNPHYLNRYITFIEQCQLKNVGYEGHVEQHHICPKANDMFPEYKDFKKHPWNKVVLSPRQHFIAHLMLWKSFFTSKSQCHAAWQMKHKNDMAINSRTYESLKADFRKLSSEIHSGTVVVKDDQDNKFRISNTDPRFLSGELVALTKGMIAVKDDNGNTFRVSVYDPKYISGEYVPITKGTTWKVKDTINYKKPKSKNHIENMKKWASVTDPKTMESKRVLRTDPLYVSGYYKGPAFGKSHSEQSKKKISTTMTGKKKNRCCCISCGLEISINNLDRHYGSRKCYTSS